MYNDELVNRPEGWIITSKNVACDDGRTDIQIIERTQVKDDETKSKSKNILEGESNNRDQTMYAERIRYSYPGGSNRESCSSGPDARHPDPERG